MSYSKISQMVMVLAMSGIFIFISRDVPNTSINLCFEILYIVGVFTLVLSLAYDNAEEESFATPEYWRKRGFN